MAANNFIQLRKANWRDFSDPDIGDIIKSLKNVPYDPWIWEFSISQEAPNAMTEIRVDFTAEFNGEATPIVLYVKPTHAQDKAAGTGATAVTIFGIDADGNPALEAVTLHTTANTQIASTTLWKRFIGAMVTSCGTGKTNAGGITISNAGQAATYGTIATGEMATIGARVYVPTNYKAFFGSFKGCVLSVISGDPEIYGEGAIITPVYLTNPVIDNIDTYFINTDVIGMKEIDIIKTIITGANTYYITFTHGSKHNDPLRVGYYNIKIIMYGTTNTLRGLGA